MQGNEIYQVRRPTIVLAEATLISLDLPRFSKAKKFSPPVLTKTAIKEKLKLMIQIRARLHESFRSGISSSWYLVISFLLFARFFPGMIDFILVLHTGTKCHTCNQSFRDEFSFYQPFCYDEFDFTS